MAHVTIENTPSFVRYSVTTSDDGPFLVPFAIFTDDGSDIVVEVDGEDIGDAFTYTATSSTTGGNQTGTLTLDDAVENAEVLIYRDILPVRTTDYGPGPLSRDAINSAFDKFQAQLQDVRRDLDRGLLLEMGETSDDIPEPEAGKALGWVSGAWGWLSNLASAAVSSFMESALVVSTAHAFAKAVDGSLTLANKAALKALTAPATNVTYHVRCRVTAGDRGGGPFLWRSGDQSANVAIDPLEGIWIAPSGQTGSLGAWERIHEGPYNLCWWNGDETDISETLQAAVDFCEAVGTGTILIPDPPGAYWDLSALVSVNGTHPLTFQGVGSPILFHRASTNSFHVGTKTTVIGIGAAGLAIGSTVQNVSNRAFDYLIDGVTYSKGAVAAGTAPGTDVVPINKYGAVAFDINAAGTITAVSATANSTGYNSAALAAAGLPAVASGRLRIGYVTAMKSDGAFTFGTTALNAANTTVAYTSSSLPQVRQGAITFRDLNMYSDGAAGQIAIRGVGVTNLLVDNCGLYRYVVGNVYLSDCYTFVLRDVGSVHDAAGLTGDYGIKIDGASGNSARIEGGYNIGWKKAGSKAVIIKGSHFGFHIEQSDFETNLIDISVEADATGCIEGLYIDGVYSEDSSGVGRAFLKVAAGITTTPKGIAVRNCNLLNTHIDIDVVDYFTEDSNTYHGSAAGASMANEVLRLGSSSTNWRLGNSRYVNFSFATTPDRRNWLREAAWISYTPTWTAPSANPAIGNGTLTGYYCRIGNTVFVRIRLVAGSTTTFGTGRWEFALPFAARSTPSWEYLQMNNHYFDASAGAVAGSIAAIIFTTDASKVKLVRASDFNDVDATVPITWANGDTLHLAFSYECA